jgi:hypothetical protein
MFKAWLGGLLLFLLGGALVTPPAQATVMIYWSDRELTERAASVVQGTVVQQQVVEIEGHLFTDSYVRVLETLKGKAAAGKVMILRQPGGETVSVGEKVAGVAQFRIGEEVLVFARPAGPVHIPVGMCLGKYTIRRGKDGVARVSRDLGGATFARLSPLGRFSMHHSPDPGPWRLVDLKQEIQRFLKGGVR